MLVGGGILLVVISVVVVRISHRSTESEPTAEFVPFKKPNIKPKDPVDYSIHINLSNGRTFKATNEADWVAVDFQSFKGEITKEHLVRIRRNNRLFGGGRSLITDSKNGKSGTLNFPRAQKFDPPYVEVWIVRINEEDDVKKEVTVSNVLRVELP